MLREGGVQSGGAEREAGWSLNIALVTRTDTANVASGFRPVMRDGMNFIRGPTVTVVME